MSRLSLIAAMVLGGLVACSTLASAQTSSGSGDKKGGKGRFSVEQQMERYTEQLNLTDAQKPKVKEVLDATAKKRKEFSSGGDVDREQMREKMKPVMEEQNKKMKTILTDDQFKKYEEMNDRAKKGGKKKNQ